MNEDVLAGQATRPPGPGPAAEDGAGPGGGALPERLAGPLRVGLVTTFAVAAILHQYLGPALRPRIWTLSYLLLEVLAFACLLARAQWTRGRARMAWAILAFSTFLEIPNLGITFLRITGSASGGHYATSSLLTTATGILVLVGVLCFPNGGLRGPASVRRALDGLIFAAATLFILWVMGVHSAVGTAAPEVVPRMLAAYINVALLGGGLVFVTSYHPDRIRGPLGWLGASALAWLAAISCWTLAGLSASPGGDSWIVLAGGIPLFQGLAACSPARTEPEPRDPRPGLQAARLLPYLPVVLALVILAALLPGFPLHLMRGAIAIFLVLVLLILLRQLQAILDLVAARRNLEARVRERTVALEQAQDTLLRTERMNTLALMGAGLAHDLNNLLSAMKSSAELAALNLDEGRPATRGDLARIASTADRAAQLTRRLMGFVRREVEDLVPTDLGRELREMEAILRLLLPPGIDFRIAADPRQALVVLSSRLRLEQMLVNLVANARDAMPKGGSLEVRAMPHPTEAAWSLIEVEDTGTGMTPEVLERIFEPFYTTKAPGKGTGLGLPSLKALVEEGGGRLEVESAPGKGACFRILLPKAQPGGFSLR